MTQAPCQTCFEGANHQCSRCRTAHYCSRQHMMADWPRHRRECRVLAAGLYTQVGYPLTVRAVLFPVEGGEPQLVGVPYRLEFREETPFIPSHALDLRPVLGNVVAWPTTIQVDGFKSTKPLGRTLTLFYKDKFIPEEQELNWCIQQITQGRGHKWVDNVIGFRNTAPADRVAQFEDVTEADVQVFKKYFAEGGEGNDALDPATKPRVVDLMMSFDGNTFNVGKAPSF